MTSEHAELVGEMLALEKMTMADRLKHAKKRRAQQLKAFANYEKQLGKDGGKKTTKQQKVTKTQNGIGSAGVRQRSGSKGNIRFEPSILLLDAASRNDKDEVRNLLTSGVSPDVCNEDGLTALHQCCIDNLEDIVKLLLEFGADVNARDSEMWTPLHAAATCGHTVLCTHLCENGAELLAVNADGNMPYDLCEDGKTLDYIESQMANAGVTQELIDDTRLSAENSMLEDLKKLQVEGGSLESRGRNGETPLHIAACNGYIHVTEFLIQQQVDIQSRDNDDWQAIHCAACWAQSVFFAFNQGALLKEHADCRQKCSEFRDIREFNIKLTLPVIEILLEHGASTESKTKNGETVLDLCEDMEVRNRIVEVLEMMEQQRRQPGQFSRVAEGSTRRRSSMARRGSNLNSHGVKRGSIHDKSSIAHREAAEEAQRLHESMAALSSLEDDEDDGTTLDLPPPPKAFSGSETSINDLHVQPSTKPSVGPDSVHIELNGATGHEVSTSFASPRPSNVSPHQPGTKVTPKPSPVVPAEPTTVPKPTPSNKTPVEPVAAPKPANSSKAADPVATSKPTNPTKVVEPIAAPKPANSSKTVEPIAAPKPIPSSRTDIKVNSADTAGTVRTNGPTKDLTSFHNTASNKTEPVVDNNKNNNRTHQTLVENGQIPKDLSEVGTKTSHNVQPSSKTNDKTNVPTAKPVNATEIHSFNGKSGGMTVSNAGMIPGGAPPAKTLAELKKQRAQRQAGLPSPSLMDSGLQTRPSHYNNGNVVNSGGNMTGRGDISLSLDPTPGGTSMAGPGRSSVRQRYSNTNEVVLGGEDVEDKSCCSIM